MPAPLRCRLSGQPRTPEVAPRKDRPPRGVRGEPHGRAARVRRGRPRAPGERPGRSPSASAARGAPTDYPGRCWRPGLAAVKGKGELTLWRPAPAPGPAPGRHRPRLAVAARRPSQCRPSRRCKRSGYLSLPFPPSPSRRWPSRDQNPAARCCSRSSAASAAWMRSRRSAFSRSRPLQRSCRRAFSICRAA